MIIVAMNGQQWNEERNRIREHLIGLVDRELPPTTRPEAWTGEDVLLLNPSSTNVRSP